MTDSRDSHGLSPRAERQTAGQATVARPHSLVGVGAAIASAATFGLSGSFARPLLGAGWSPAAAVAVRTAGAALVLAPFAYVALAGRWGALVAAWRRLLGFGILGVAGAQLCFFAAIERLSVGVAILIEFLGPVLLVVATSIARRRLPPRATALGAIVSVLGLGAVLDLGGVGRVDPVGLAFALTAAAGVAGYFHLAGQPDPELPPVAMAAGGLCVGAVLLVAAGLAGLVPFHLSTARVDLFGADAPWWVPMSVIVVVSTAFSYGTGVFAAEQLGARLASFVALLEALFAVLAAWVLLGERPTPIQGIGGVLIVAGVLLVRLEASSNRPESSDRRSLARVGPQAVS